MSQGQIVECVPNFSEGRDTEKIERIVAPLKGREQVRLVNYEGDRDYNRLVVTVLGEPRAVKEAILDAIGVATELIDLNHHEGEHLRMGATDVVPLIPIRNMTIEDTVLLSKELAREINERYQIPVFLYEDSAANPGRVNLAHIRRGQFEGMAEKLLLPEWEPDFGERKIHPTAGVTAVGARFPLIAYNIDLGTDDIDIANKIAKSIRQSGGGFQYIKAGGVELKDKGIVQVTMNITDYRKNPIYRVFETVKMEAARYGVPVVGSEVIGLAPLEALTDSLEYYLGLHGFDDTKIIEHWLMGD
ncbi:MAG: glutamate formimidoyltransferase [Clostridiales bacterium]|jgi:glutamate formiminotransferase|nr:glutamate formimidoyltransferase [Clostridiales bacterium]MDY0119311.1 glutamate formimidoyltransferase [Clostridia bacterium]NLG30050.1 glutamate formimidoyltransferase [Clostridiaceae bacterium]